MNEDEGIVDVEDSFLVEDLYQDDMDGDAESALASIGLTRNESSGMDESYGYFNENGEY